jgi:exosortase B
MHARQFGELSAQMSHGRLLPWALACLGFAAMYVPVYGNAAQYLWRTDEFGHAPIVLLVVIWLFWRVRHDIASAPLSPVGVSWPLFALGLLLYLFGRTFSISSVEFLSQIPVAISLLLLLRGRAAVSAAWFALLYLVFMVPLPGALVDALTGPLKQWISTIVVELLYRLGYPIARTGVVLTVGPYQLLVADACSGLHSMFSLAAVGTLFMYLTRRASWMHNAIMLAAIVPIAFGANIVRVIALVLITYHAGDAAGQGFLHSAGGMVLYLVALASVFLLDMCVAALTPSQRLADRSKSTTDRKFE